MTIRRYIDTTTGEEKTFSFEIDAIEQLKAGTIKEAGSKPAKKEEPKVESTRKAPRRRPAADKAE